MGDDKSAAGGLSKEQLKELNDSFKHMDPQHRRSKQLKRQYWCERVMAGVLSGPFKPSDIYYMLAEVLMENAELGPAFYVGKSVKSGFGKYHNEHMWVTIIGHKGTTLNGILMNQPVMTSGHLGKMVKVNLYDIEMWMENCSDQSGPDPADSQDLT